MVSSLYLIKTFKRQYRQLWCLNHNAIVSLLVDKRCDNKRVSVKCNDRNPYILYLRTHPLTLLKCFILYLNKAVNKNRAYFDNIVKILKKWSSVISLCFNLKYRGLTRVFSSIMNYILSPNVSLRYHCS